MVPSGKEFHSVQISRKYFGMDARGHVRLCTCSSLGKARKSGCKVGGSVRQELDKLREFTPSRFGMFETDFQSVLLADMRDWKDMCCISLIARKERCSKISCGNLK